MQPGLIRLKNAPLYLGMDKNRFNTEVRPLLIEIPIGKHGIAFDRQDLDQWILDYKTMHGKRPIERKLYYKKLHTVSAPLSVIPMSGANKFTHQAFEKALAQVSSKKHTIN